MSCILAVDDRPINLQFLASLLGYGGHNILQASNGEEALDIVRRSHPDLIITDVKMPKMDGYEFVDRLREDPKIAQTPVIFYTALYHELEAHLVAESYGVKDIINKPSEPEEILRKVNAALGKWGSCGARGNGARSELEALQATGLKLSALVELGMELGSERDARKLLSRFCSTARHIISARKSMLGILSETGDELKYFLINGLKDAGPIMHDRPPVQHSLFQRIVNDREVVRINYGEANAILEGLSPQSSPVRSILGVPVMSATQVYGWLILVEKQHHGLFNEEDERLAITLAAQAGVAYENVVFAELLQLTAAELDHTRREQLEMKDQFFSHVSHELRSPLAALHQFTTIVLDGIAGELNPEQREYLEVVFKNSLQLRDMITDLLDVTRADAGKLVLETQSVELAEILRPVFQVYQPRAAQKGIELYCNCSPKLPPVKADANRVGQVFANLLDNALKFTQQGTISISASEDRATGFVRVDVQDTGCGIPADSLRKVFDRLYQSPHHTNASRKGLGLGLHICQQLIELHSGRIWVDSREGHGATFSFTLPLSESQTCRKGTTKLEPKQNSNH